MVKKKKKKSTPKELEKKGDGRWERKRERGVSVNSQVTCFHGDHHESPKRRACMRELKEDPKKNKING